LSVDSRTQTRGWTPVGAEWTRAPRAVKIPYKEEDMKNRLLTEFFSACLAFAFTIVWLCVFELILKFITYHMIWRLPAAPQLIGDMVVFVLYMGLLLGLLTMTRNNYRAIKQMFLNEEP
jgi:hypothetical protein